MIANIQECIKPISYFKTNTAETLDFVNETKEPLIITQDGVSRAVLIDVQSYQKMQDAFNLLKIIQLSKNDIKSGKAESAEKVFADLREEFCANVD